MNSQLYDLVPQLAGRRILVVGDVILDEYLTGKATRMSREAPVPVLEFDSRDLLPGGAANPAANITALGSSAIQVGIVGADSNAIELQNVLQARSIDASALIRDPDRPTTVKTRIMAQMGLRFPQQIARLDILSRESVNEAVEQQIIAQIDAHMRAADAILLSDYHGGLLTAGIVASIREKVAAAGKLLTADAQGHLDKYRGFTLVKCNADEAPAYLGRDIAGDKAFGAAAQELCKKLELAGGMVITRGAEGATLATTAGKVTHCPAPAISDVFDTVGAGDTAIAVITLALAAGAAYADAVTLANYASGIVVRHVGNYTPSPDELHSALQTWSA